MYVNTTVLFMFLFVFVMHHNIKFIIAFKYLKSLLMGYKVYS